MANTPPQCGRSMRLHLLLLIAVCAPSFVTAAEPAPERVLWTKAPIAIALEIAAERRVQFPTRVKVGLSAAAVTRLQVLAVDDTVYLLANQPVQERLAVQEIGSGRIYLLDVVARAHEVSRAPIVVMTDAAREGERRHSAPGAGDDGGLASLSIVALARYAAQQVYAPRRLLQEVRGISRVPLHITGPVPLMRGGEVEAMPLASWRSRDYYVTALRLRNLTGHAVTFNVFDPRADLRGHWVAASFHRRALTPRGEAGDASALYLVSVRSFEESLDMLSSPPQAPAPAAQAAQR